MSAIEKVSYLKGLFEGLGIDPEAKEGKMFSAIITALDEIAAEIDELDENIVTLAEDFDDLEDDFEKIEEIVFGDDDDDDDDHPHSHDHDRCCDDEDCDCDCDDEDIVYEVSCPICNENIVIDEAAIEAGGIVCPKCGEKLEFEFDDVEDEE
ncbi:MAG: TFIIB-type zinc ribbon-containing protein [Oscillospiraceae bacterium]|jgi:hypothetical protein|nr:TFIIB-type zinc ribbon-containing protein [Oscillospiraceae bacterium]